MILWRDDVEPEREGVEQAEELVELLAIAVDFQIVLGNRLIQADLLHLNRGQGGLAQGRCRIGRGQGFTVVEHGVFDRQPALFESPLVS